MVFLTDDLGFLCVRESGQEVCRIYAAMDHVDFHRQNQWPDIYNFFIETC
jgi:hypothetical protein